MSNVNTDGLPPEMQARIAQIIDGAKQKAIAQHQHLPESPHQAAIAQPPAPVAPPTPPTPTLMDHTMSLRQEVADLRNELASVSEQVAAMGQVTEAVGQAVGQMYAMFHQQTSVTDQGSTYSSQFQEQVTEDDY